MKTHNTQSGGVLLSRFDPKIQRAARQFLDAEAAGIDVLTAEDPVHAFFHDVDRDILKILCGHIAEFLDGAQNPRIILAGGQRPDTLTDGEVFFKLQRAAVHLQKYFEHARVEVLFVNQQTGRVEVIVSGDE